METKAVPFFFVDINAYIEVAGSGSNAGSLGKDGDAIAKVQAAPVHIGAGFRGADTDVRAHLKTVKDNIGLTINPFQKNASFKRVRAKPNRAFPILSDKI
jgi:hypothetical protein